MLAGSMIGLLCLMVVVDAQGKTIQKWSLVVLKSALCMARNLGKFLMMWLVRCVIGVIEPVHAVSLSQCTGNPVYLSQAKREATGFPVLCNGDTA